MSILQVSDLTFCYEGSFDNIFENVSFRVDTDWKLGFTGRNGKGKTTFLRLLLGEYEYSGSITTDSRFDYFPYPMQKDDMEKTVMELKDTWKPACEDWQILCELSGLDADPEILYRPVGTLSQGERTKAMLAVLFSGENEFLLIDEPTNHLDGSARQTVTGYLSKKKSFILVSHDRVMLDSVCDHMLVLNRDSIEVVSGNFSSWWDNKEKKDAFAIAENEKHTKEIGKLKASADRADRWASKNENTKIGFDPVRENDRSISTRSYIGAKTKKMQSRVKNFERRMERQIAEKEGLLNDIETVEDIRLTPLLHHKKTLVECRDLSLGYEGNDMIIKALTFSVLQGEIVFLNGRNGCGKSSLIKALLARANHPDAAAGDNTRTKNSQKDAAAGSNTRTKDIHPTAPGTERSELITEGLLSVAGSIVISYISQDTSFLKGPLKEYAESRGLDYSLLLTLLRKLDLNRIQFEKNMEDFSEGQKKKVLIASSLLTPAHLYIWDEPLNYIDVFSRMQIEKLIENCHPTMILVEHDEAFRKKLAGRVINLP
ncbi:MAG: ABC-F family ATP-binding cassette domain-containing protein [Lachnospiraceae bacterium]|nr:ABC-F family ATP-binding cassette domain-containing protein [Lachnospiraceae bacterium]